MACGYCMIKNSHDYMDFETAKVALEKYIFWTPSVWREKFVYFFGWEPFLNFSLIKEIVNYIQKRKKDYSFEIRLVICSNFTLISKKTLDWILKNNIFLSISIGWIESVHNQHRIFKEKTTKNAFEITTNNIKNLQNLGYKREQIWVWLVVRNKNISDFFYYFKFIVEQIELNHINIEFIIEKEAWRQQDFIIFKKEYKFILKYLLNSIKTWNFIFLNNLNWTIIEKLNKNLWKFSSPVSYLTEIHPSGDVLFSWFFTHLSDEQRKNVIIENIKTWNNFKNFENIWNKKFIDEYFSDMQKLKDFNSWEFYPFLKSYISNFDEKIAEFILEKSKKYLNFKKYIDTIFHIYF